VAIVGESAQVVDGDGCSTVGEGACQNSVAEEALKKAGEDGDDVKLENSYARFIWTLW
jgi:hypothetical protein